MAVNNNEIKILLVDDQPSNLHLLSQILLRQGYKLQRAISGQLALNAAMASPPDLILLDIMMPEINGYEVCQQLKSHPKTQGIPIIFLSALQEVVDKVKAFNLGGFDYITKPFRAEEILARIENQLTIQKLQKQLKGQNNQLQQEVRERQEVEATLANRNALIESILNSTQIGICLTDENGYFVDVNPAYCQLYGFTQKELLGQPFTIHFPHSTPEEKLALIEEYKNFICNSKNFEKGEFTVRQKNGRELIVDITRGICQQNDGKFFVVTTIVNNTARKQAELALAASEKQYRDLVETSQDVIFSVDTQGYFTFVNRAVKQIYGYEPEEMIGRKFSDFQPPAQVAKDKSVHQRLIAGESVFQYETTHLTKDGRLIYLLFNAIALRDEQGNILGTTGTASDITERKHAEQALRNSEERWQLAIRGNNDGIWDLNLITGEVFRSARWMEMLGYEEHEIENDNNEWINRIHPDDFNWVMAVKQAYLERKIPRYVVEHRLQCKDGTYKWILGRGQAVWDENGLPVRMVGSNTDISERRQRENALRLMVEGIAATTGDNFMYSCARYLAEVLQVRYAFIGELVDEVSTRVRTLAFWQGESWGENFEYLLANTPYRSLLDGNICYYPQDVQTIFPEDQALVDLNIQSYLGIPLLDSDGKALGLLVVLDVKSMEYDPGRESILKIFAARAGAELERKQAEEELAKNAKHSALRSDIGFALSQGGELFYMLTRCAEAMVEHLGVAFARIWTLSQDESVLELQASAGLYTHIHGSHARVPVGSFKIGLIAAERKPHLTNDALNDPRVSNQDWARREGMVAFAGYPLIVEDQLVGVMAMFARHPLSDEILNCLASVASEIAVGIERKQASEALHQSEERLYLALEGSNLGLWDWYIPTGQTYFDPQWKKMLGYEVDEIENNYQAWEQRLFLEDRPRVLTALSDYLEGHAPTYEAEFRMQSKSGEWKWIQAHGKVFERDAAGSPLRMTGTNKDISDRKQTEEALRLATERLQHLLTSSPAAIYSCKAVGDYGTTFISENVTTVIGYEAREFLEDSSFWSRHIHQEDVRDVFLGLSRLLEKGYHSHEYRFLHKDGTYRWVSAQLRLLRDTSNNPIECVGYWADITNRKQAELALQESQRRYRTLAEASPVCIFHTDAQGNCLYVNQRWSEITGLSLEEALGTGWTSRIHSADRDHVFAQWSFAAEARVPFKCEYRFVRTDGTITWVISQALAEIGDDGEIKGYVGTITDISEDKQAQEALQESAERERALTRVIQRMRQTLDIEAIFTATTQELRQAISCDRVVVYRFDPDWSGEFVAESVGREWSSLIQKPYNDSTFTKNTLEDGRCAVKTLDSTDDPVQDTYLQDTKGGMYRQGVSCLVVEDIYQAKFSPCYINLLEEFQARAYITVPIFCGSKLWGLLATYQNSGPREWKTAEINTVVQIGNQLAVALQQAQLLTQTQKQSAALQQAVIAADAANRAKSEFLASMSHELRTPLNAILGFTQVMNRDTSLSSEQQQNLKIINRAGEHLLNLINDILEMSKIEAGRTTLNESSFDLFGLLDSLEEMLRLQANSKKLQLIFRIATDVPQYVRTDESKLRQVLINLLGNAIKFTDSGNVTLRVMGDGKDSNTEDSIPNRLYFEVEDTGSGISTNEIGLLFEAFAQTETGRKSQQGTGLGLPISRKYIELMGGNIRVSSTPGQGSVFAFDIQISLAETDDIQTTQPQRQIIGIAADQPECRILVVDDVSDSRLLLVKLFTSMGFRVQEARNGQEAVALWESWQPQLIWMDMRMPVMDGYEATQQIKAREQENLLRQNSQFTAQNRTVIIAFTASAFEEERKSILSAGCDDLVCKPFREEVLLEKISEHLGVQYVYVDADHQIENTQHNPENNLTSADLLLLISQMSAEWIAQVHHAAAQCSDDLILRLVEQIPSENVALGNALAALANDFHFEKIMEFTQQEEDKLLPVFTDANIS